MPSSDYFSALQANSQTVYLSVGFLLLCIFCVGVYFYAQKPKRGTLEWIDVYQYKRKNADPFIYDPLTGKDLWIFLLAFVTALIISSLRFVFHYQLGMIPSYGERTEEILISGVIASFFLSLTYYIFFRLFFTSRYVAYLITCLSCALHSSEIYAVIFLLGSWIFLFAWICCVRGNYRRIHSMYFLFSAICYGFALMTCWATLYLIPIYIGGCIVGVIGQWHRGELEKRKGHLLFSVLLILIGGFVVVLFLWLLYCAYNSENMNLFTGALWENAYHSFVPTLLEKISDLTVQRDLSTPVLYRDLFRPILFLTSMIPSLYGAFALRKSHAITAVYCAVFFLAAWLIAGVDLMCPGSMLSIGWMFKGLRERGYKLTPGVLSLGVVVFYYVSLLFRIM